VSGDWTTAIQQAITDLNTDGGGTLWVPTGVYNVNGALQDPSGANSIIKLPTLPYSGGSTLSIAIKGFSVPSISNQGSVIQTAETGGGSILSGYDAASSYPGFTAVLLNLENIRFRAPDNPNISGVNGKYLSGLLLNHVIVDNSLGATQPTHTGVFAVQMPTSQNNLQNQVNDLQTYGYYIGQIYSEHTSVSTAYSTFAHDCYVLDAGNGVPAPNGITARYLWAGQSCVNGISAGANHTYANVALIDIEAVTGHGINDPSNLLAGVINYAVSYPAGAVTICNAAINGATSSNLSLVNLNCSQSSVLNAGQLYVSASGIYGSYLDFINTSPATPNHWAMQVYGTGFPSLAQTAYGLFDTRTGVTPWITTDTTFSMSNNVTVGWSNGSGDAAHQPMDTGLSRDSAGVVDVGNGTAGNASGTLKAANLTASSLTSGNCVQASTGGLLTTTGGPCSGGSAFITSLTTTGSSGAASVSSGVLNIPIYSGGGSGGLFGGISAPTLSSTGFSSTYGGTGAGFATSNTPYGVYITQPSISGSGNVGGIVKAYPGVAYTATALMSIPTALANYPQLGLIAADTLSGKAMLFRYVGVTTGSNIDVTTWSNPTTFVAAPGSSVSILPGRYLWLRLKDDGTNITYSISSDNQFFQQIYTVAKSSSYLGSGGFNYLGIFVNSQTADVGSTLMSWTITTP
jgi:hypothetical protein